VEKINKKTIFLL